MVLDNEVTRVMKFNGTTWELVGQQLSYQETAHICIDEHETVCLAQSTLYCGGE